MIDKESLEKIAAYDVYVEAPNYDVWKSEIELIEQAKNKLNRYHFYFQFRKLMAELGERDSDIHIVSHAKSGTTLTQMMLYQILTNVK